MSIEALALVLHHSRATGTDKLVLLGIANHAGDGGAWPTVETLARYANTTERTVQRSLSRLVDLGEVVVHRQAGGTADLHDFQRPNRYDVIVACPINCDHTAQHRLRPLPKAQADLWTEGVTPTSPGDAHVTRGATPTSPGGVTPTSPKPSTQLPTHLALTTTDRARPMADCDVCSLTAEECMRRPNSGHDYSPKRIDQHRRIERIIEEYSA